MKYKTFFLICAVLILVSWSANAVQETIFSENFSGSYPGSWDIYSTHSMGWAWPNNYAHCYAEPSGALYYYPDDFFTSMEHVLDFTGYTNVTLNFNYIADTEENYDWFQVWIQDSNEDWYLLYDRSGPKDLVWNNVEIDLSQFDGQSGLTIAFDFSSDGSVSGDPYEGGYVDGILITGETETDSITITSPNGGENWEVDSEKIIRWTSTGNITNVKIEYSIDNGDSWKTVKNSTANDGNYRWQVPSEPSVKCRIKISDASDGNPWDISNSKFSIVYNETKTITVSSPNGGESWPAGSTRNIIWTTTDNVGDVKIKYSSDNGGNWTTVTSSTANDGIYSWTVPNSPSSQCLVKILEASDSSTFDTNDSTFSITSIPPEIALNRDKLNFGSDTTGVVTSPQTFLITNDGGGQLNWNITADVSWLSVYPTSGTGEGSITVSVIPGQSIGTHNGTISVSDSSAGNSPQPLIANLTVYRAGSDSPPFGSFATPTHGSTVRSSIPVTGWVLDDIGIEALEIWRKTWVKDEGGDGGYYQHNFIGNAVFIEGARPDVEQSYSGYPMNYQAGWGYMLLTNFLPNKGNGEFILYAKAIDKNGHKVTLGEKTIYCDNQNAVKPFGAIDSPEAGGSISGTSYRNQGWVLTPMPNKIPEDGSTIKVYIDGVDVGSCTYNIYRDDIAKFFPGYANSNGALAFLDFDTTVYSNGIHAIHWIATDTGGNTDGIGSRYFSIHNVGGSNRQSTSNMAALPGSNRGFARKLAGTPGYSTEPLLIRKGFGKDTITPDIVFSDHQGIAHTEIRETERIEIRLYDTANGNKQVYGFLKVGEHLRALPAGATLDSRNGVLYWIPAHGFEGEYRLVFIDTISARVKHINITIQPKYTE